MIHQYYSKEKLDAGHSSGFKASTGTVVGTCLTGSANLNWDNLFPSDYSRTFNLPSTIKQLSMELCVYSSTKTSLFHSV